MFCFSNQLLYLFSSVYSPQISLLNEYTFAAIYRYTNGQVQNGK